MLFYPKSRLWICTEILKGESIQERTNLLEFFIQMALVRKSKYFLN